MEDVNPLAELDRQHLPVCVALVPQGDLENTAAELDQLQLVGDELLCPLRDAWMFCFGITHPNEGPQDGRFVVILSSRQCRHL